MDYFKLFLINGVLGYCLQSMGDVIAIAAFNKIPISAKELIYRSLIFGIIAFGIRQINAINFGFHTILIMIIFIVISIRFFKTSSYPTVLAVLLTSVMIIVCETINYGLLSLILDPDTINYLLKGGETLNGQINKALVGIPTNIMLIGFITIIYKFQMKRVEKEKANGEAGQ